MPRLEKICLKCVDPDAQKRFYCDVLGMRERRDGTIGYEDEEAGFLFESADAAYEYAPSDLYWKVAISVPDIDLAVRQLKSLGIAIEAPRQFREIAYLTHFKDPEGYTIELLDHWFKGQRPEEVRDDGRLGGGPGLNLLTLRTTDIDPIDRLCSEAGMAKLSIMPVTEAGFTLHFYAFTSEMPPNDDLLAVENRPWTFQRPYTVLEIQHVAGLDQLLRPQPGHGGYAGAVVGGLDRPFSSEDLLLSGI